MPDLILDALAGDGFSAASLTDAVNFLQGEYSLITRSNLFVPEYHDVPLVALMRNKGTVMLVPSAQRGAPAAVHQRGKRDLSNISIPHFPVTDSLIADDLRKLLAAPGAVRLTRLEDKVLALLAEMKANLAITREALFAAALSGLALDADGSVLFSVFGHFSLAEPTETFDFSDASFDLVGAANKARSKVVKGAAGNAFREVYAYCAPDFYAKLIKHRDVYDSYVNWAGVSPLREDLRTGFRWQDIIWISYEGYATDKAGNERPFIAPGTCRFIPVGGSLFRAHYGPPTFFAEGGGMITEQTEFYANSYLSNDRKSWHMDLEMNLIPVCRTPEALVKGVGVMAPAPGP